MNTGVQTGEDVLADIAPFVCNGIPVLLTMIGAYFDESERLEAKDPLCVAGFVFKPTQYKTFCREWKRVKAFVKPGGVSAMHMKDLVQGRNEFEGIGIPARVKALERATAAIKAHAIAATGAMFDQDEFEAIAGEEWPDRFGSTYSVLCQRAAETTVGVLRRMKRFEPVIYVFEAGHTYQHETDCIFRGIRNDDGMRERFQYGQHVFELKRLCYGAQAADILAWTSIRINIGGSTKAVQAFIPALTDLAKHFENKESVWVRHYKGEALRAFIAKQINLSEDDEVRAEVGPRKRGFRK